MKKAILIVLTLVVLKASVIAQDVNRTIGVGLQASFPSFGLSLKYAVTDQSVVQATIAPFGMSSGGTSTSFNYYGLRYIHRFIGNDETSVVLDPYLFVGGGLMSFKTTSSGSSSSSNTFGYSAGGGLELILGKKFGISAEIGYGKLSFSGGVAVNSILSGGGLHFYFK